MPLINFVCPDNTKISISDCLKENGCRMNDRCATRSYLKLVGQERKWTGKPSTTQLIRGTMEAFLLLTKDYSISPDERAFVIHGTKSHNTLENSDDEYSFLEEKFDGKDVDITGIADVIEIEGNKTILADYKTSGSFKVAKALGFKVVEKETEEIYKTGKKKGQKKTRKELVRDNIYKDVFEWKYQLNKYRIEAEAKGLKIDELRIQCIVRDGNTHIARSRGVFRNVYYFKVNILPDEEIINYFNYKKDCLIKALKQGYWNEICTNKENWEGLKCSKYCSVAEYCNYGKYLKTQKQSEEEMIKGLSQVRRLPRLGKIRLGIKKTSAKGAEYPVEIDYFKLDPQTPSELENKNLIDEFHRLYGEKPKQIKVMFPILDPNIFFPQFYKRYGYGVLKCKGDGEEADCISKEFAEGLKVLCDNEMGGVRVTCLGKDCKYYKDKKCSETASLSFLLPELKGAGVWEINTGSFHSIVNINSCLEYVRAVAGRVHMIPLTLERREQEIQYEGKKSKHYILHINMDVTLLELQKYATIDATKIMLELPEPNPDKEDILFQDNKVINENLIEEKILPAEIVEEPTKEYQTLSEEQALDIVMEIKSREGSSPDKVIKFYSGLLKDDNIKNLTDIPSKYYDDIIKTLKRKPLSNNTKSN